VPRGLRRIHGGGNLHFITSSCYHREQLLGTAGSRDVFLRILEQVRNKYGFGVIGYVAMPEHVHLLITEPKRRTVPVVMQVLKQRVHVRLLGRRKPSAQRELWKTPRQRLWQRRYYDFNVYSDRKVAEKLRYMHVNPVKRGLVSSPELWRWSSYRAFAFQERGLVTLNWQEESNATSKAGSTTSIVTHPPKTTEGRPPSAWNRKQKAEPE